MSGYALRQRMPFVGEEVAVRQSSDRHWVLLEDLRYEGRSEPFTVQAGFKTDFASVPGMLTWLVPTYGRYTKCAILHDHLCVLAHAGKFSRYDADGIFRRSMREQKVGLLRRWLMWLAVRWGSGPKGMFERGFLSGAAVVVAGLACLALLAVPLLVVGVWLFAYWLLEWSLVPFLKLGTRRKQVNPPQGLSGVEPYGDGEETSG